MNARDLISGHDQIGLGLNEADLGVQCLELRVEHVENGGAPTCCSCFTPSRATSVARTCSFEGFDLRQDRFVGLQESTALCSPARTTSIDLTHRLC